MNWSNWTFFLLGYGEPPNPQREQLTFWILTTWLVASILQGIRMGWEEAKKGGGRRRKW